MDVGTFTASFHCELVVDNRTVVLLVQSLGSQGLLHSTIMLTRYLSYTVRTPRKPQKVIIRFVPFFSPRPNSNVVHVSWSHFEMWTDG